MDEAALLEQALKMSMIDETPEVAQPVNPLPQKQPQIEDAEMVLDEDFLGDLMKEFDVDADKVGQEMKKKEEEDKKANEEKKD